MDDPGDDDEVDDIDDLWVDFAEQWERAFKRMSEAEDAHLQKFSDQVEQLAMDKLVKYGADVEAQRLGSDLAAKHHAKLSREVVELEHAHAVKEVHYGAEADRASATAAAMKDSDDMVKDIEQRMAQRRVQAEAKRKEAKKKREAEAEARRRSREQAPPGARSASSGPSGPSGPGGASQRARSGSRGPTVGGTGTPAAKSGTESIFASFVEYDAAWSAFEERIREGGAAARAPWLQFTDIPWPTGLSMVSGITVGDSPRDCKKKLRAAMLRWHPDKWAKVMAALEEPSRAAVIAKVQEVTRRILDEKRMHS